MIFHAMFDDCMNKIFFSLILPAVFLLAGCAGNTKTDDNTAKSPDTYRPERAPYDGFVWERLSGAGLVMWAQRSPQTFLQTDASVHGVRLCTLTDNGVSRSEPLVQVFDLKAGQLDSLLPYLLEHPRVESLSENDTVTCAFQQVESGRMGVRRYVLVPTGEGADALKKRMENKPVPTTCGGWGMGNSGMRYFEIFSDKPNKAVFVEIGQEAPLFDEKSIQLHDSIVSLRGQVVWEHESHSFAPEGDTVVYWLTDDTQRLEATYDAVLGAGAPPYTPVRAQLMMRVLGPAYDGFAAEYDGVMEVIEIGFMEPVD